MEHESDGDTNYNWQAQKCLQRVGNGSGGGALGVMVIAVGNGHGDTRSNPGRD